ncbi:hypothetical protein ACHAC9_14810 [Massilia sp. CMS3.1]
MNADGHVRQFDEEVLTPGAQRHDVLAEQARRINHGRVAAGFHDLLPDKAGRFFLDRRQASRDRARCARTNKGEKKQASSH